MSGTCAPTSPGVRLSPPTFVRTVILHHLVWCQAIVRLAWCQAPPFIFVRTVKRLESALVALFALCGNEVPDMSAVMMLRHGSKPLNVPPLRKAQYIVAVREGKILIGSNACSRFLISSPLRWNGKVAHVFPSAARINVCVNAPTIHFPYRKVLFFTVGCAIKLEIPEPGTLSLVLVGIAGLLLKRRHLD